MISAYLDRMEEDKCVLLVGEEMTKVVFPRMYLPEDAYEGVYLKMDISLDEEATEAAENEALELLKDSEE